MYVVPVVKSGVYHLYVVLGDYRFLRELVAQEVLNQTYVAVEEPAYQSEGEHVAAFQYRLVVHAAVCQTVFYHLCYRACHNPVGVDVHLCQIIFGLELCLFKIFLSETVRVYYYCSLWFCKLILCFQCRSVHCHQHIALVTGCVDFASAYVNLKSRHACKRALRGTYVCRIVRKSGYTVADSGRNSRKNVSRQLHTVAGVA